MRPGRALSFIALGALASLHAWSLMRVPAAFVDEAWFANRAWALLKTGTPIGTLDVGVLNLFSGSAHFFPLLSVIVQAAAMSLASEPSLAALRLVSLVSGLVLAGTIWTIGRSLYGEGVALVAVILLALSLPFTYSSHLGRYDMLAAAFGYGGVGLYFGLPQSRASNTAVIAGFCSGVAVEFHPFAAVVVVALVVLVAYDWKAGAASPRVAGRVLCGLVGGMAVYPLLHIVPDPATYFALNRIFYGPTHVPLLSQAATGIRQAAGVVLDSFGLGTPAVVAAALSLAVSRDGPDRRLVLFAAAVFAAFAVLVRNKLPYYAILLTPALTLCVAAAAGRVIKHGSQFAVRMVVGLALIAVLFVQSAVSMTRAVSHDFRPDFRNVQIRLNDVILPGERVMGSQTYWFGLWHHDYYSWEQLVYLRRLRPELSVVGALEELHPDIFIRDRHLEMFLLDEPGATPYIRLLQLPKTELEGWLASHSAVVADFDAAVYGRVRVYRIQWRTPGTPELRPTR